MAENLERVGGNAGNLVVRPIHNKFNAPGQGAEFANNQPVANKRKMVEHIALKIFRILRIVVIGVIPDQDIGIGDSIFDKAHLGKSRHGVLILRAGAVHGDLLVLENAPRGRMFPGG